MKQTIILPQLVALVAERTQVSEESAKQFLTQLFGTITDTLAHGQQVKVKGIGTFIVSDLDSSVKFMPDKSLADAINEPFASFEAIELADDYTDPDPDAPLDELVAVEPDAAPLAPGATTADDDVEAPANDTPDTPVDVEAGANTPTDADAPEAATNDDGDATPEAAPLIEPDADSAQADETEPEVTYIPDALPAATAERRPTIEYIPEHHSPWGAISLGLIIGLIVGFLLGLFIPDLIRSRMSRTEVAEPVVVVAEPIATPSQTDTIAVDTKAVDTVTTSQAANPAATDANTTNQAKANPTMTGSVVDVVTKNHFLTTMARKYYDNRYEFWVYIYEENKDHLGHPDMIKPGTVVTIPSREKYGIDPASAESVRRARQKAGEIYARFARGK